jgi:alkylated DNA nucleotide flippase Atl1
MRWQDLVIALAKKVPEGSVTTYAEVSAWGYGKRNLNQPVRSLLRGAINHGFGVLTNRVVGSDGELAELPEGTEQQRKQLQAEGITFTPSGAVDLQAHEPVVLPRANSAA